MASAFTLFGEIKADTRGFKSSLKEADSALHNTKANMESVERAGSALSDGLSSAGRAMTAAITLPVIGAGAAAIKSAVDFDTLRTQLKAATGSTDAANSKFKELNALAQANAGVLTKGAVATYGFLKPLGFMDETINETIKAFGKLKAANPEVDLQRMGMNLAQLFDQGFEAQDIKELLGNFPRAGEILQKAFGLSGSDRKTIAEEMKAAIAGGLTREDFFKGFAGGVNTDQFMAGITDPIAVQWEKMVERIKLATEPLGVRILTIFAQFVPPLIAFIERISAAFLALSPTMQTAVIAFAAIAAAAGPILLLLGSISAAVVGLVAGFTALAPIAPIIGIVAAAIAGLSLAMGPVIAIAAVFYQAWAANWELVKQVFNQGVAFVQGIVQSGLATLQGFWTEHGTAIMEWANAWWTTFTNVVSDAMQIMSSYVKLGLQLIQGDWQGAWQTVLDITHQVWAGIAQLLSSGVAVAHKLLQAALPIIVQAFVWLGTQILTVITKAMALVVDVIFNLPSYLLKAVSALYNAGLSIGKAIWEGIQSGLTGGLMGGGAGLNLSGSAGPIATPFTDLLASFKNMFGGAQLAGVGGELKLGSTFLSPIKLEAINTAKALDNVARKIDTVKAKANLPTTPSVPMYGAKQGSIYGKAVEYTDSMFKGELKVADQKVQLEILDPNGRTTLGGTSGNVNARYGGR